MGTIPHAAAGEFRAAMAPLEHAVSQGGGGAVVAGEASPAGLDALTNSRETLELAIEVADIGVWEYDFATRRVTRSLRHDQHFGYDELQPKWSRRIAREHFLPEDRHVFDEAFDRAVSDGKLVVEGRVRWPDGSIHWLRSVGRTYYDDDGTPVRMVGVITDETERRYASEALGHSEARFRLLADAMPQLVWTARIDGRIDYFNRRIIEYGGLEAHDGLWHWDQAVHPDDRQRTLSAWERAIETGTDHEIEHRLAMADGSHRWHLTRAIAERGEDGDLIRWYGTSTDIHSVKVAEAGARAARERLEVALEAAEMGTWESDFIAGTSHRSARHDQIFGYDEMQPSWSLEAARAHVLEEDLAAFDRAAEDAERTGRLQHEVRIRRPDGTVRWIYSLGRHYYDDEGRPVRRAGVVMDVTDRKESEQVLRQINESLEARVAERTEELEAARDRFQTIFHASPTAAAIIHRADGRLLDVNDEFTVYFGYGRDELVERTMDELDVWGDATHRARIIKRVARRRSLRNEEILVRLRDGSLRTVLGAVEPIELGDQPCALVRLVDITERKRAEEAVRRLSTALTLAEQRERRRLSQVLHDDLQQILFGIEMRASVLEHSLLAGSDTGGEANEHLEYVRELLRRAIQSTRALSIELNPPILTGEGLEAALRWLARHMEEMHGLRVDLALHEEAETASEDERLLLVQLARELLFNVVKHAGVREARLVTRIDGNDLVLTVEDQGFGFDAEGLRERSSLPTSLGLFSIRERLRLFGGTLKIESSPGMGTKVHLQFPLEPSS